MTWPDIAGAAAAFAVWVVPAPYLGAPRRALRADRRVGPGRAGAVSFPKRAYVQLGALPRIVPLRLADGFVVLFRKSFWYGSVIWLWRASGLSLAWITAVTAAALFALERAQVYLPGRTPEITDAVLAVLMGVLLWLLRDA